MAAPKLSINDRLLGAQQFVESLVARFNEDGNAELGLTAQQTVVAISHLRERAEYWDMGDYDFDWEPGTDG